jgi:hypothetical protein
MDHATLNALKEAKQYMADHPELIAVEIGYRVRNGEKNTDEVCIVFTVREKLSTSLLTADTLIPAEFGGVPTDVIQGVIRPSDVPLLTLPSSLTSKKRPCPAGFSIGHPRVTAGTFGVPVKIGTSETWHILTNAHVAAPHWDTAKVGDPCLQPGKHDGGREPTDRIGALVAFVTVNGPTAPTPPKKRAARAYWAAFRGTANGLATLANTLHLTDCDYRLKLERTQPQGLAQPTRNRVDLAIVEPFDGAVDPQVWQLGPVTGIRDFSLGDGAQKQGRTTDHTQGTCDGKHALIRVDYGAFIAEFDNQDAFRASSGDFSAGGDSGSGILHTDMFWGALLFAGGGGRTYGNPASDCVAFGPAGLRVS